MLRGTIFNMNNKTDRSVQLANIIAQLFNNCQLKETLHAAKYNVSIVEFRCLSILYENSELTVKNLAQKMNLTSSRITRIIDGLVKKDYVKRLSGQEDRRVYNLILTAKSHKLAAEMIGNYIKIHDEILNKIPANLQQSMIDSLSYLNEAVDDWIRNNGIQPE